MHARCTITISFRSMIIIFVHNSNLSFNKDFLFESIDMNVFLYVHIVNSFISSIIAKNDSNETIKIFRNARLEMIIEIQYSNAFQVEQENDVEDYVERRSTRTHKASWFTRVFKTIIIAYIVITTIIFTVSNVIHSNEVTIHNSKFTVVSIFKVIVNNYFDLWKSEEFVKLFQNQWMRISLRSDWKNRIFEKIKVYLLRLKDKKLVDKTFDDLQEKKRLKYITKIHFFQLLCLRRLKKRRRQEKRTCRSRHSRSQCNNLVWRLFFVSSIRRDLNRQEMSISLRDRLRILFLSMKSSFKKQT